ncbi:putative seryl-tRNA synthetase [Scenedesmus sp. NREL 46B-D3]|nr:putative seryl-tRNA synthetase [Scenedesmus sp. NREL 46B-D3]
MLLQRLSQAGSRTALLQRATCIPSMRAALRLCRRSAATAASATEAPTAAAQPAADSSSVAAYAAPAYKVNIDFKFIRDNLQLVSDNCKLRDSAADPALVAQLYDDYVKLKAESDQLRSSRNENSAAMKGKLEADARAALIAKGQQLKQQLEEVEAKLAQAENALQVEGQRIPNLTHPDVPTGGEENATVMSLVGEQRAFDFPVRDHVSLGEALGILDFETAAEVSGSKFYYLKGAATLLELALVNWAISRVAAKGFNVLSTPDLVRMDVLEKCGFQPRMENTQVYSVKDSNLCLTGTAEVPLAGVYMDKVLAEKDLPVKMVAYGRCFRTEAGAAGAAGKGLYRVHQFTKVEMFVLATPEQSDALHQELIAIEQELFTELGLHFKVLDMPSGDLGAPAYRKFDVEAWMPGLGRYGEISSASNCTDYQARRLNIRSKKGKKGGSKGGGATAFVHTLNATACAVPRMLVAILENFQQADGSVVVPEVLRPYLGGMQLIQPPPSSQ